MVLNGIMGNRPAVERGGRRIRGRRGGRGGGAGPWAPSSSWSSMSPVRDGPVRKLTVRGSRCARPEAWPHVLEMGDEAVAGEHRDVGLRQEVEGRRGRAVRDEDEGPVSAIPAWAPVTLTRCGVGRAARHRELVRPANALQERVRGDHDVLVEPLLLQVVGDGPGHALDPLHRRERRSDQRHLLREPGLEVAFDPRANVHLVGGEARLDRPPPGLGLGRIDPEAGTDRAEDSRPRGCRHDPVSLRRRHARWKVSPSGAGRSRTDVQPPARGSRRNAPRRRPSQPMTPIAAPVRGR